MKSQGNGFSTTPTFQPSGKKSWEIEKPEPSKPPIDPVRMKKMEEAAIKATGGSTNSSGAYPETIQRRNYQETQQNNSNGPKTVFKVGASDYENYGMKIPRYTSPETAAKTYISGDVFDPKQTLFRYDAQTLNVLEEKKFRDKPENKLKPFTKPHEEQSPVYEGLPKRSGVEGLARVSRSGANPEGSYLIDLRELSKGLNLEIKSKLSLKEAFAVREYYAIPTEKNEKPPNSMIKASIKEWNAQKTNIFEKEIIDTTNDPNSAKRQGAIMKETIIVSRTVGYGEQIIGNVEFFKFNKVD